MGVIPAPEMTVIISLPPHRDPVHLAIASPRADPPFDISRKTSCLEIGRGEISNHDVVPTAQFLECDRLHVGVHVDVGHIAHGCAVA